VGFLSGDIFLEYLRAHEQLVKRKRRKHFYIHFSSSMRFHTQQEWDKQAGKNKGTEFLPVPVPASVM
jgi:hypothetical protein